MDWTACIEWVGPKKDGYGRFASGPLRGVYAHRVAWIKMHGPIPEGLYIDHLCRNRGCQNVAHMELVTTGENTLRGFGPTAMNARKTTCPQGHPLTPENLYPRTERQQRDCKTCGREQTRRRRAALGAVGLAARVAYNRAWRAKKRAESSIG